MSPLGGSQSPQGPGTLCSMNHWLSPVERQKPDPGLLLEGVNQDVRVTSGWLRRRNFIWIEAPLVTAGAHQIMTKHVAWCAECGGHGIYKSDLFTSEIFGTGDLPFLTWSLTQWPMFPWILRRGHLWKPLAPGHGWRFLKAGGFSAGASGFNSSMFLSWDLSFHFSKNFLLCKKQGRRTTYFILLGKYLTFLFFKL